MNYLDQASQELSLNAEQIDKYQDYDPSDAGVLDIEELRQRVKDHILQPKSERGLRMESKKLDEVFRARPGELTVESGKQGCGKSARHTLRAMAFAFQGEKSCICSMEMKPEETIERMFYQYMGNNQPPISKLDELIDYYKGKIFLFSKVGTQTTDRILNLIKYCADNGIRNVMIDSLMKCSVKSSDIDSLEDFTNKLQGLAKDLGVHVWLIAHQTKEKEGGSKEDGVRGSGMLLDLADNFIYYAKNIRKFELKGKQAQGFDKFTEAENKILEQPDFFMDIRKQRHSTIALPRNFGFWGHDSMQFLPGPRALKMNDEDWKNGRFN